MKKLFRRFLIVMVLITGFRWLRRVMLRQRWQPHYDEYAPRPAAPDWDFHARDQQTPTDEKVVEEALESPPDDLTVIKGIGPSFRQMLNEAGIFTYQELASQEADALAILLPERITAERIRREQWIEQAHDWVQQMSSDSSGEEGT